MEQRPHGKQEHEKRGGGQREGSQVTVEPRGDCVQQVEAEAEERKEQEMEKKAGYKTE